MSLCKKCMRNCDKLTPANAKWFSLFFIISKCIFCLTTFSSVFNEILNVVALKISLPYPGVCVYSKMYDMYKPATDRQQKINNYNSQVDRQYQQLS